MDHLIKYRDLPLTSPLVAREINCQANEERCMGIPMNRVRLGSADSAGRERKMPPVNE